MLCLNCGKDIGDTVGLCGACESSVSTSEEAPAEDQSSVADSEPVASTSAPENLSPPEKAPAVESSNAALDSADGLDKRSVFMLIGLAVAAIGLVGGLIFVVFGYLMNSTQSIEPTTAAAPNVEISAEPETPAGDAKMPEESVESIVAAEVATSNSGISAEAVSSGTVSAIDSDPQFPTAPHIVSGTVTINGRNYAFNDAVMIHHGFDSRTEIGFYRSVLAQEVKQELLKAPTLAEIAPEMRPDMLVTVLTRPNVGICSQNEVSAYSVRFFKSAEGLPRDAAITFGAQGGGLAGYSCVFNHGSPFVIEFSQTTSIETDGAKVEYQWDINASGPVYVSPILPTLSFNPTDYWSLGLYNKETHSLSVGFFRQRLNADQRKLIREGKSLTAIPDQYPDAVVSFEVLDGFSDLKREGIRSYGIEFLRRPVRDLRSFSFPGLEDKVSFYEIVGSEVTPALDRVSGYLFEGETVHATLKGAQQKEVGGQRAQFVWDIKFTAPVIDVFSEPVSSVAFEPELAAVDRTVPAKTDGVIEAAKASLKLVDAAVFYYPVESTLVIGMYQTPLTATDRATLQRNQSVWQSSRAIQPNLVITLEFEKGSTSLMRSDLKSISMTFIRDRLGDFYFPGNLDRATVKKLGAELNDSNLSHISGLAENGGTVALRLKGTHISDKSGLNFAWNLGILSKVTVVQE